ncbi:thiamine diphosphokinase [Staphylospora marina]|uniref:thiamine diphosphokinase n=1 Tax=Staphylospora marina TaxID=2490858 RepID=UPI0013DDE83E|nr:thiamine diphosphokinase [Staphylospora marina]
MGKRRVIVVTGGELTDEELLGLRNSEDRIVAVDGGAKKLLEAGIVPDLAVGDFDTAGPQFAKELEKRGVAVERLPEAKAMTDTHYALERALSGQPDEIILFGALGGGRVDHMLANIGLLEWLESRGVRGIIQGSHSRIRLLAGPGDIAFVRDGYPYVSLIPLTSKVEGIRTRGMKYPLYGETLTRGMTRGISNELNAENGSVSIVAGKVLVVESRDR